MDPNEISFLRWHGSILSKMTDKNSEIHFVQLFNIIPVLNNMSSGLKMKTGILDTGNQLRYNVT